MAFSTVVPVGMLGHKRARSALFADSPGARDFLTFVDPVQGECGEFDLFLFMCFLLGGAVGFFLLLFLTSEQGIEGF